ncbi:MAG: hypothetical protein ACRCU0_00620 [Candidatus Rhabdochlamydia sp.]
MGNEYFALQKIIDELHQDISISRKVWDGLKECNPHIEQLSEKDWRKEEAQFWIHGTCNTQEKIELESGLYPTLESSKIAKSLASISYSKWEDYVLENSYLDFTQEDLIKPQEKETLVDYIQRYAQLVENHGWKQKKNKRALKAFLTYLKKFHKQNEVAFIEHLFPEKMDLHYGKIIKLVQPQVYPVSKEVIADIIKALAQQVIYGRPDALLNIVEALSLTWLCLIASRIRLPFSLKSIHAIQRNALILNGNYPELLIPSDFGKQKIRISHRIAQFFELVAKIPSSCPRKNILQGTIHDLRRALNKAIHKANLPPQLGKITFLTFLSSPHPLEGHVRYKKPVP